MPRSQDPEALQSAIEWTSQYASITPGWSDLFGQKPTWDDFFARIRQYPIAQALVYLGHINAVLEKHPNQEGQLGLCHDLFKPNGQEIVERLAKFASTPVIARVQKMPTPFYTPQVLITAKLVLAYQSESVTTPATSLRPLAEALLMATDLVQVPQGLENIAAAMTASFLATRTDVPVNGLARSFELYMTDRADLHQHPSYVNLPEQLTRITGLPPDLFWLMLFSVYGEFEARPAQDAWMPFSIENYFPIHTDANATRGGLSFTKTEVQNVINLLSATIPELVKKISDRGFSHESAILYDVMEFAEFPLVREDGKYVCMSVEFLLKKLISGMHYIFLDQVSTTNRDRLRYFIFLGAVFEKYVDGILARCMSRSTGTYSGLLTPPSIKGEQVSCCDAVWHSGDALVLFEIKAKHLDLGARVGIRERLDKKLEDIVFDSARQIDSTIKLFKEGKLPIGNADPAQIRRFFPIVITLESLVMHPLAHMSIMQEMKDRGLLQQEGTRPIQLMNVAELEHLEVGLERGLLLLHILAKKLDMETWRGAPFQNFFLFQYPQVFKGAQNTHLLAVFNQLKDRAVSLLQERGARE